MTLGTRHALSTSEVLGHLVRMQARSALGDLDGAAGHADAVDVLAARHERPLAGVFTAGFRALRLAVTGAADPLVDAACTDLARRLDGSGMPGVADGLVPLARLCLRVSRSAQGAPVTSRAAQGAPVPNPVAQGAPVPAVFGPYAPWAEPLLLLDAGRRDDARRALLATPEPGPSLVLEALWCLTAHAAVRLGERETAERAAAALAPAAGHLAGAGSGMLSAGTVDAHLAEVAASG
ncbi:hypothetical protein GCM10025868_41950 [Angustibacter aerolatus]|uniref:Uncharacterized protein n=1 Tax=Angustibacter aerolatus TaxID=1162965 RepID=A0ABQ6JQF9_9ACTN|nr:hypothetical protein [Angustibacter aerolatus]GMA88945.1 hypothetical protein GCM10025868_41950 [Angustibacter aerolatus]